MNQCPIPLWAVPLTDRGNGWYQDILPVAKKGLLKEQHKSSDHGSTKIGPKHQIHRGMSVLQLTGPKLSGTKHRGLRGLRGRFIIIIISIIISIISSSSSGSSGSKNL